MIDFGKYRSLFSRIKEQPASEVFAFFPPLYDPLARRPDYHAPWIKLAENTLEGRVAWEFVTEKYKKKYAAPCSKLRNYVQYTFARLKDLEVAEPGKYFIESADGRWVCFNTGLQDHQIGRASCRERAQI